MYDTLYSTLICALSARSHSFENPLLANEKSTDCVTGCADCASTMAFEIFCSPSVDARTRATRDRWCIRRRHRSNDRTVFDDDDGAIVARASTCARDMVKTSKTREWDDAGRRAGGRATRNAAMNGEFARWMKMLTR